MKTTFYINQSNHIICRKDGTPTLIKVIHINKEIITQIESLESDHDLINFLRHNQNTFQFPPIGVIGPREATQEQYNTAQALGKAFARLGITVVCGGKMGVMEAVCKGVSLEGGRSIGILPDDSWDKANAYVTIPIVTGMGPMRNSIIANSAFALVAIGGGYGTLTEMAYGLHYNKPVMAIADAPSVDGVQYFTKLNDIVDQVTEILLDVTKLSTKPHQEVTQ